MTPLKITSSECQSNGKLKQAWVKGGRSHDSIKIASALNFQCHGNSNKRPALPVPRVRLPAGDEQRGLARDAEVRHSGARSHRLRAVAGAARPRRALWQLLTRHSRLSSVFFPHQGTMTTWAMAFPRINCRATTATVLTATATVTLSLRVCLCFLLSHLLSEVHRRQKQLSDFVETKKYWALPKSCGSRRSGRSARRAGPRRGSLCTRGGSRKTVTLILFHLFVWFFFKKNPLCTDNHCGSRSTAVEAPGVERCRCACIVQLHVLSATSLARSFLLHAREEVCSFPTLGLHTVLLSSQTMDAAVSSESAAIMEACGDLHPPQAEWGTQTLAAARSLRNHAGSHMEPGRDSCAHGSSGERGWTKKAESAHVFASRTVTLAANMRGGMWTQIVCEGKSDRVHPHGPLFPHQLVSHSPTHWITQDALLDMTDAIDTDNARTPWWRWAATLAPGSGLCTTARCCEISQHHARLPAAHQIVLGRAELHGIHSAAGLGRTCAPSRTRSATRWPNTSPSSSWKSRPTSNVSIGTPAHRCSDSCCSHSCTLQHRTQKACNIELLAGAASIGTRWSSVSLSQKQNVLWRHENCFHKAQPRSLTRQRARGARVGATGRRPQRLPLLQREQPWVWLRGCKLSVSYTVASHQRDSTSLRKMTAVVHNPVLIASVSTLVASLSIRSVCCFHVSSRSSPVPSLALRMWSNDQPSCSTRSGARSKNCQIDSSFLIPRVVLRGRSQLVESWGWLLPLVRIDRLTALSWFYGSWCMAVLSWCLFNSVSMCTVRPKNHSELIPRARKIEFESCK